MYHCFVHTEDIQDTGDYVLCDLNPPLKNEEHRGDILDSCGLAVVFNSNCFITCEVGNFKSSWSKSLSSYYFFCLFCFFLGATLSFDVFFATLNQVGRNH